MSWASIANNQTVSFNNLQDAVNNGVFTLKAAIPVSLEQITKSDANTHVYINTSYGPYASKASNQLVVKSNLQAITYFYLSYSTVGFSAACSAYPTTSIYYASYGSTLQNGTIIYTDAGLTNPAPAGYYSDGTNSWQITSGGLAGAFYNQTPCTLPCECYVLYNNDSIDISISFYECGGSTINPECLTCPAASQIYLCIQGGRGSEYTVSYGTTCGGGPIPAYTLTALGTNCTTSGDCI
jgi:hypothetical protein